MNKYLITYRVKGSNILHSRIETWDKISAVNIAEFESNDKTLSRIVLNIVKLDD